MKTILTLDKANQPYGFAQLDINGNISTPIRLNGTASYALTASYIDPIFISQSAASFGFGSGSSTTINIDTGSFATTGSNTFTSNQWVKGYIVFGDNGQSSVDYLDSGSTLVLTGNNDVKINANSGNIILYADGNIYKGSANAGNGLVTDGYLDSIIGDTGIVNNGTGHTITDNLANKAGLYTSNAFIGNQTITGSFSVTSSNEYIILDDTSITINGDNIFLPNLPNQSQSNIVGYNYKTGQLYYQTTPVGGNVDTSLLVLTEQTSSMLAPYLLNSQTGSFITNTQTSSFATTTQLNAYVQNSQTSSFITNSQTSSFITNSQTSSFITNSQTGSMSVQTAITSSYPISTVGNNLYSISPAAGTPTITQNNNIFLGQSAGANLSSSLSDAIFIGRQAGLFAGGAGQSINNYCIGIGYRAGINAISASYSVFMGYNVGGSAAGGTDSTGTNNIVIGTSVTLDANRRDSINLGGLIFGTGSYFSTGTRSSGSANGKVGINVPNPQYSLDVSGSGNYTNGLTITGSLYINNLTNVSQNYIVGYDTSSGQLTYQTSSFVLNSQTGSFVQNNQTSSFVTNSQTGSFAKTIANSFNGNQTITGSLTISGSVISTGSVAGNVSVLSIASNTASLNLSTANFFTLQLVGGTATHINPTNITPGQTVNILISTTGSATVTFPSTIKQPSGFSYTATTSTAKDILTLVAFDSTTLYMTNVKNLI